MSLSYEGFVAGAEVTGDQRLDTLIAWDLIRDLDYCDVLGCLNLAPDCRRILRGERDALAAAIKSDDSARIVAAIVEARRVMQMWGV